MMRGIRTSIQWCGASSVRTRGLLAGWTANWRNWRSDGARSPRLVPGARVHSRRTCAADDPSRGSTSSRTTGVATPNNLVTTLCVVTRIPDALRPRTSVTRYATGGSASAAQSVPIVRSHAERGNESTASERGNESTASERGNEVAFALVASGTMADNAALFLSRGDMSPLPRGGGP
jgi:hypothetical protein